MERVKREVEEVVGLDCSNAILTSAKQGIGIRDVLEAVVQRIPPPPDNTARPLRALIFDSYYDAYKAGPALSARCHAKPCMRVEECGSTRGLMLAEDLLGMKA